MIFSYKKLLEIANLNVTIEQMTQALNQIGFEVEGYWKFSNVSGIKFANVIKTYPNKNSNKLTVCELQFADKKRIIQTAAKNVRAGDYLMAFIPGAHTGKMEIQPKEMQGIVSEGMLVSLNELGFKVTGPYSEGIFTFPKVKLKLDPMEYFHIDDYMIDVAILSNRSDANSHYILARELAAFFQKSFKQMKFVEGQFDSRYTTKTKNLTFIESTTSRVNLSIQEQLFLMKMGFDVTNTIVDLANLTQLITGMPTSVYDIDNLNSNVIDVKKYSGSFVTTNDKNIEFNNALTVLNGKSPIALAGIINNKKFSITPSTKNCLIQMGIFDVSKVRETTKEVKENSDFAIQSSKFISLGTLQLGHHFLSKYLDMFSHSVNMPEIKNVVLDFDFNYLNKIANQDIVNTPKFKDVKKSLQILGFEFLHKQILIPSYRHDIATKQDIVEEVFRFYGLNNLTVAKPSVYALTDIIENNDWVSRVASLGYQQVWTYSLTSKEKNIFNPFHFKQDVELKTFVSQERAVFRNSIATSIAEIIDYNEKRKFKSFSFFDIGFINENVKTLTLSSTEKTFLEIKQDLINLFGELDFRRTMTSEFHPGVSAIVYKNNVKIGWIGKIHPKLKISDAFFAEILLDKVEALLNKPTKFTPYSSDQLKRRDLTIGISLDSDIAVAVKQISEKITFYELKLKDIFIKEQTKQVTFSVLLDEEQAKIFDNIFK